MYVNQFIAMMLVILSFSLSGCATNGVRKVDSQSGVHPKPGELRTVAVGDVMYEKYDYIKSRVAMLDNGGKAYEYKLKDGSRKFCVPVGSGMLSCYEDNNNDGVFEIVRAPAGIPYTANMRYSIVETMIDGYKRELLYQGTDGKTIRLKYREFRKEMARPAFYQEVQYPLMDGKADVRYQGLTIHVKKVDPSTITYSIEGSL